MTKISIELPLDNVVDGGINGPFKDDVLEWFRERSYEHHHSWRPLPESPRAFSACIKAVDPTTVTFEFNTNEHLLEIQAAVGMMPYVRGRLPTCRSLQ